MHMDWAAEVKRRVVYVFDRHARLSYAQEGEDRLLQRLFEGRTEGFYVDVGAHHPKRFSNTYLFYTLGWCGINIEANPQANALFNRIRPRDTNLAQAISDHEGPVTYYMFAESALNTLDGALAEDRLRNTRYRLIGKSEIRPATLRSVLERWLPAGKQIDFLSIDVEGHELSVLRSSNWTLHRPKVVLVESLRAAWGDLAECDARRFLESVGYAWFAKTMNTHFFVESDARRTLGLA